MTVDERRRRVEQICDAALDCGPESRATFLDAACGSDTDLRKEVDALLKYEPTAVGFLETPLGAVAAVVMAPAAAGSRIGTRIGQYEIRSYLGQGGMSEVYRARDTKLERDVAIKVLPSEFTADLERLARFEREAKLLASLSHPNIGAIYGLEESDGTCALVLELIDGETLADVIARGPLPLERALQLGLQIADALDHAHRRAITHRDLKPSNVMLTKTGAKLLDFGLAKVTRRGGGVLSGRTGSTLPVSSPLTNEGALLGTLHYMAPEQLQGQDADGRSDIFAFGVLLYEMLTGKRAFDGTSQATVIAAILTSTPSPASTLQPSVPARLDRVIAKCLAKDRETRWQSVRDVADELTWTLDDVMRPGGRDNRYQTAQELQQLIEPIRREAVPRRLLASKRLWMVAALALAVGLAVWRPPFFRRAPPRTDRPVLAILPVDNPTGDPQASCLGDAIASLVASNVRALGGVGVLSRVSTMSFARNRGDLEGLRNQLGAEYVLDLTIKSVVPQPEIVVRLQRLGSVDSQWQQSLSGDPVKIERTLLDRVAGMLSDTGGRRFTAADWARIRRVPSTRGDAVLAYCEARALLDRSDVPANVERAIDRLQSAVSADASFPQAHAALGTALLLRSERPQEGTRKRALIERATPAVMTALRLDPELSGAHYAFGMLQYITGRRDSADQSLRRAIELDPDSDEPHRLLGWRVLFVQGQMDEAVAELREAVRIRPDSFENHYRLGNVFFLGERYRDAVEEYRAATVLQPTRADVFTNLGAAYHMLGDDDQSAGNYQHAISLGAGDAMLYGNLAYAYFLAGRYQHALDAGLEAAKREPTRASLQRDLGEYFKRLGKKAEARDAYSRAIALAEGSLSVDPRAAAAVALIALCEANLGRPLDAERRAAHAVSLAPTDRDVLLRIAEVYALLGNRARAFEMLRSAIERGFSPQLARQDPQLSSIKPLAGFEVAIAAGLRAREQAGKAP